MPFRFPSLLSTIARLLAGLVVCAAVGACSSESTPPVEPGPGAAAWRWVAPVSEGATLTDVWGPTADNLFASGTGGVVLRYDGSAWRKTSTPTTEQLNAIWGTSADNVIAVDEVGTILRYDGTSWKTQASGTNNSLKDVWGSSATDVFAVGGKRTILHFDGVSWSPMTVPAGDQALTSVWGSSGSDVYATGLGKKLLHYDGNAWSEIVTTATFALTAVWGAGPNDVFAVGVGGEAVYFDGLEWTPINIGAPALFNAVWGTSPADVYAVGQDGAAYRWDGGAWSPVETSNSKALNRVFGVDGRVFAVGDVGTILNLEDNATHMTGGLTVDFKDVWVSPRGEVFVVGDRGTILRLQDGVWETMPSGTTAHLRAVHGIEWNDAFAVGENGTVLRFDGASWTLGVAGPGLHLSDVWMLSSTDAFAVGDGGLILRLQGGVWSDHSIVSATDPLLAVWGATADEVYVVGRESRAFKWDGIKWKLVTIDATSDHVFHDVYGTAGNDVYVASEYWGPAGVAGASAPLAAGSQHFGGFIFHWDGTSWYPTYPNNGHDILSVWAASPDRAFACGDAKSLLDWNDGAWTRVFELQNLPDYVRSVWGASADDVFVVGDNGTIARYSR